MKEGRKPEYPEQTRGSESATYYNLKIQAPSETRTRTVALVAGLESRHANRYTTRRRCYRNWGWDRIEAKVYRLDG